eukprot:COSAG03_NODE_40_length_17307_cov_3.149457_11_plen_91_part_00
MAVEVSLSLSLSLSLALSGSRWLSLTLTGSRWLSLMTQWEIDFLKYDSCLYNGGVASRARYEAMSRALNATGRKVFFQTHGSIFALNLLH